MELDGELDLTEEQSDLIEVGYIKTLRPKANIKDNTDEHGHNPGQAYRQDVRYRRTFHRSMEDPPIAMKVLSTLTILIPVLMVLFSVALLAILYYY